MTLADFQQTMVDLTASPELCREVRATPKLLLTRYELSNREIARIIRFANDPGMECNCILYRTNRLAPLALNLPDTCRHLGRRLKDHVEAFWSKYPESNVHFFVEVARFCDFVADRIASGSETTPQLSEALARESAAVHAAIVESHTEDEVNLVRSGLAGVARLQTNQPGTHRNPHNGGASQ